MNRALKEGLLLGAVLVAQGAVLTWVFRAALLAYLPWRDRSGATALALLLAWLVVSAGEARSARRRCRRGGDL